MRETHKQGIRQTTSVDVSIEELAHKTHLLLKTDRVI